MKVKLYSVYRGLHDLVIAETKEQALAIVERMFKVVEGDEVEEVDPQEVVHLNWSDEYDPEFNLQEVGPFKEEDGSYFASKTAQEWVDWLGPGILATESGGCLGPHGTFYRSFWKESRKAA